jgi:hypothetical protein
MLAPDLCLFGDNSYLNTPYMAAPYAAVSSGTKMHTFFSFAVANLH